MQLFFRKIGNGETALIILHGLYGASDNWLTLGKKWSEFYTVYLLDLRNHGQSPHSNIHSYQAMQDDVLHFMNDNKIPDAIILGHSMGGKVAMHLALNSPQHVKALIVVDIAPKNYTALNASSLNQHKAIIRSMLNINLEKLRKRADINTLLASSIPEKRIRQFIMKNLKRNPDQSFSWKLNLEVLFREIGNLTQGFPTPQDVEAVSSFPVLFVRGEQSNYILKSDEPTILNYFPLAKIQSIPNAGHWLHAEQTELFEKLVLAFLNPHFC